MPDISVGETLSELLPVEVGNEPSTLKPAAFHTSGSNVMHSLRRATAAACRATDPAWRG